MNRKDAKNARKKKLIDHTARATKTLRISLCALCAFAVHLLPAARADAPSPAYSQDFEKLPEGDPPGEIVVLGGLFTIKSVDGNKVLELPGDPVDGYGVLFGPEGQGPMAVSARIFATATGKRAPEFGVGLGDTNGDKLWGMPAAKQV